MKRLYILLLINIIFSIFTISQAQVDYLELYRELFPQSEFKNQNEEESFNETVGLLSKINPDLLYYYFELHYRLNILNITNPDSNFSTLFNYHRIISREKRSNWAKYQVQNIEKRVDLGIKRNKMESYIDDFIMTEYIIKPPNIDLPVDSNKLDYINMIYYSQLPGDKYDKNNNYFEKCRETIKKLVYKLNKQADEFDELLKSEKIVFIENIINYSPILDNINSNRYSITTNFELYELIFETFNDDFKTNPAIIIESNFYPINAETNFKYSYTYTAQYFTGGSGPSFNFEPNINLEPIFDIGIGYKFKLREENRIFSYVDLIAHYIKCNITRIDTLKDMVLFESTGIKPNEWRFTQEVLLYDLEDIKHNSFGLRLYTPIYYFSRDLFIEIGLTTRYYNLSYAFKVSDIITFTYLNGDPTTYQIVETLFVYDEEKFVFNGAVAINIQPIKQWLARVEFLTEPSLKIGVRYNLEF